MSRSDGFTYGVGLSDGTDGATVSNVAFSDNLVGIHKGTTATISNFQLLGGSMTDGLIGIDFDKTTAAGQQAVGTADQVTIDGTSFSHLAYKGIYAEALSHAHLTNITMNDVGQFGAPSTSGTAGTGGDGIDLNLKNGTYSNIEIDHFHLTDTGLSTGGVANAVGDKNGGAIVVEGRDQGSYASTPGVVTDTISIHDGTIDGSTSTGVQAGEPGQTNAGPATGIADVSISGAQHNALHGDVANVTQSTMTVVMKDGGDSLTASPTTIGPMIVNGGDGNDTITTGAGNDTITGGGGNDTFVFAPSFGKDTVTDFAINGDHIDIQALSNTAPFTDDNSFATWLSAHGSTPSGSGDTLLDLDLNNSGTETILLKNIALANLHYTDFIVHS